MATLSGTEAAEIIATLADITNNVNADEIIRSIKKATESCVEWAGLLESLMQDMSIVYARKHDVEIDPKVFDKVALRLNDGKTILMGLLQTMFAIEPLGNGKARILHGWQGDHLLGPEQSMPIEELCDTLTSLTKLDHVNDTPRLERALSKLFGKDHAPLGDKVVRRKITPTSILEGLPRESLTSTANRPRLRGLSKVIAPPERARLSGRSPVFLDDCAEAGGTGKFSGARIGASFRPGLGFALGAGVALYSREDWENVGMEGAKAVAGGVVKRRVTEGVVRRITQTMASAGKSIVRANAAAGIALFGVFAVWDVIDWKMHKITAVGLRKRLAEGAGATGGGAAGAAAGAAGGMLLGPGGAVFGGLIGGIAGGIGGMFAAKGIDYAIWDQGEDAVMNSYEFFGWHNVKRNTRPQKNPEEMGNAYAKKLDNKPKKMKQQDWDTVCLGTFMILAKAMYPIFQDLIKLANEMREHKSNGLSVIATLVFEQIKQE